MIKINVLSKEQKALQAAIETFERAYYEKSFASRHPELGKMINCPVCLLRHRAYKICTQKFAVGTHDPAPEGEKTELIANQTTKKGVLGAAMFAKKRVRSHHSARLLQLVERTRSLYMKHTKRFSDPNDVMLSARAEAKFKLALEHRSKQRKKNAQKSLSRRINRGS